MSEPKYVDFVGKEIQIGDIIVYPVRRGSEMALRKATVCERPGIGCVVKQGLICLNDRGRRIVMSNPERCVVVSKFEDRNNAKI